MPSHYLNQCWHIVHWNPRNKLQWNLKRNSYIFIKKNTVDNIVCKMVAILSRPHCVNYCMIIAHSSLNIMATILQTTFSIAFNWDKIFRFEVALKLKSSLNNNSPESKVHEAYMGPTWGRQDPGGSHVGPVNLAIRVSIGSGSNRLNWWQAITLTSVDPSLWHHMASLVHISMWFKLIASQCCIHASLIW